MNVLSVFGIFLMVVGGLVTMIFWVPQIVDRAKLKEMMGARYPVIYLVYIANGPMLMVLGILLLVLFAAPANP